MNIHYSHFMGGSQKCTQGTPLVKARNSKKLKMLNLKFAWISDPAANTMQTAVAGFVQFLQFVVFGSNLNLRATLPQQTFALAPHTTVCPGGTSDTLKSGNIPVFMWFYLYFQLARICISYIKKHKFPKKNNKKKNKNSDQKINK